MKGVLLKPRDFVLKTDILSVVAKNWKLRNKKYLHTTGNAFMFLIIVLIHPDPCDNFYFQTFY